VNPLLADLVTHCEQLLQLAEAGRWEDVETRAETMGELCDQVRLLPADVLQTEDNQAAIQHFLSLFPQLSAPLQSQLDELRAQMAMQRNQSRLQGYSVRFGS
jgi:hypothetical protein